MAMKRREAIRLLGGAAGVAIAPLHFACGGGGGAVVIGSGYVPTPEAPLTPTPEWYVNTNFGEPSPLPDPARWRLHLRGMVDRELTLSLDDFGRYPLTRFETTLECIG